MQSLRSLRLHFARLAGIAHFVPLSAAALLLGVAMSFTAPYLSLFGVEAAGMSPLLAGVFMTLIAASGVVASTWAGRWSDRRDRHRPLLVVSLAAAALGFALLCMLRAHGPVIAAGTILLGAGAVSLSQIFSFARAVLPVADDAQRELASAALRTMLSIAWVFGPALGALILAQTGFTGLFLAASAGFVACAAIVARIPEPVRRPAATHARAVDRTAAAPDDTTAAVVAPRARVLRTLVALTLMGLAANATMIVLPLYIVRGLGGTPTNVSAALGLAALLEIPMMLWLGIRSTRLDKARWLTACALVHAAYFIGLAAVSRVDAILPLQLLSACVVAITSCLGMTRVCDLMPTRPGTATAMFFSTARVGSIASGVLSGACVDLFGYRATFAGCCGLALVAFALLARDARGERGRAGGASGTSGTSDTAAPARRRFDAPH